MIYLKSIQLNNFLSHRKTELTFSKGDKILLDGQSGAGKSSIIEAVVWCLFGKGRSDNRNIIRKGEKEAIVTLAVMDGKIEYNITRKTTAKGKQTIDVLKIEEDEAKPLETVGLKDTQDWIEKKLLKSSYLLFINSIVYPQENIDNFVKQTAAKRKEMLLEIIDTEDINLYYNRAKDALNSLTEKITRQNIECDNLKSNIETNRENADNLTLYEATENDLRADIAKNEADRAKLELKRKDMDNAIQAIKEIDLKISNFIILIENKDKRVTTLENEISEFNKIDLSKIEKDLEELLHLRLTLTDLQNSFQDQKGMEQKKTLLLASKPRTNFTEAQLEKANNELMSAIIAPLDVCEHCGKPSTKLQEAKDTRIADMKDFIQGIEAELKNYEKLLVIWQKEYDKVEAFEADETLENSIIETELAISRIKSAENIKEMYDIRKQRKIEADVQLEDLRIDISTFRKEITGLNEEKKILEASIDKQEYSTISSWITELDTMMRSYRYDLEDTCKKKGSAELAKESIKQAEVKLKELGVLLQENAQKKNNLSIIKEAFGSKGIQTLVIDLIIPQLEDKINSILSELSDFKVSLDTQKASVDGENMIEGLFINIFNGSGEEFDFQNYSGGEKGKINYSIFEALSSFQRCDFRLLDEHISGLHADMIDEFAKVMLHLDKNDTQVLCVSHLQEIKDRFEQVVLITKEGKTSKTYETK